MRRYLSSFLCACFCTCTISAQDVIVKRNGDEIQAKITKVSDNDIEYKKWSNLDGPVYTMGKSDIFMIKYPNGEKDVFDATETKTSEKQLQDDDSQTVTEALPASNNALVVSQYNSFGHKFATNLKKKDKYGVCWIGTLGVKQSSVLSTDDIQIGFVQEKVSNSPYKSKSDDRFVNSSDIGTVIKGSNYKQFYGYYEIVLTNKTTDVIYVDLASSFVMDSDASYHAYYSGTTSSVTKGGSSGGSVNLGSISNAVGIGGAAGILAGGINVGGGKSNSTTTTYANDRVIMIPPNGKYTLSKQDFELVKSHFSADDILIKSLGETFHGTEIEGLNIGTYKTYTEEDSPLSKSYIVSYSKSPDFKKVNQVKFSVYVKDAMGLQFGYYITYNEYLKKYFECVDMNTIIIGYF